MLQISPSCEVGDPLYCFVEVPGDVSERTCRGQSKEQVCKCVWRTAVILHLDGIETSHVHLLEPVPPVLSRDSGVMDAAWDVLKWFPIFKETVVAVVYREWPPPKDLQQRENMHCALLGPVPCWNKGDIFQHFILPSFHWQLNRPPWRTAGPRQPCPPPFCQRWS